MGLITVHVANNICSLHPIASRYILTEYQYVFQGLGCLPGEYHVKVNPNVPSVKHNPRRVAFSLKAELLQSCRRHFYHRLGRDRRENTPGSLQKPCHYLHFLSKLLNQLRNYCHRIISGLGFNRFYWITQKWFAVSKADDTNSSNHLLVYETEHFNDVDTPRWY